MLFLIQLLTFSLGMGNCILGIAARSMCLTGFQIDCDLISLYTWVHGSSVTRTIVWFVHILIVVHNGFSCISVYVYT